MPKRRRRLSSTRKRNAWLAAGALVLAAGALLYKPGTSQKSSGNSTWSVSRLESPAARPASSWDPRGWYADAGETCGPAVRVDGMTTPLRTFAGYTALHQALIDELKLAHPGAELSVLPEPAARELICAASEELLFSDDVLLGTRERPPAPDDCDGPARGLPMKLWTHRGEYQTVWQVVKREGKLIAATNRELTFGDDFDTRERVSLSAVGRFALLTQERPGSPLSVYRAVLYDPRAQSSLVFGPYRAEPLSAPPDPNGDTSTWVRISYALVNRELSLDVGPCRYVFGLDALESARSGARPIWPSSAPFASRRA